jgi:hypothetical protein
MRKFWLALTGLIALVSLQVSGAKAATVDFDVTFNCPTCLDPGGTPVVFQTTPEGGGSYLITGVAGETILTPGSSPSPPLVATNDNLLFYPGTPAFDAGGFAAYPTPLGIAFTFVDACGALGPGFNGCAVEYPDANAIDGYIHPTTVSVSATPLPAALPLMAASLSAMGFLGWRRKRKSAAAIAAA